jgi:hypothetical protein
VVVDSGGLLYKEFLKIGWTAERTESQSTVLTGGIAVESVRRITIFWNVCSGV